MYRDILKLDEHTRGDFRINFLTLISGILDVFMDIYLNVNALDIVFKEKHI